ncbi:DUF2786 domain-containing protein [Microdochium nivale]|nr:DUF2786 domain-containing protein [Microdochium nivale]
MQSAEKSLRRPLEDDRSDDEEHARKRPARTRKSHKPPPPLYKASVTAQAEASRSHATHATADVDNAIVLRIKKCLDRAKHPNTPEAEAKAALHLASRLMGQYNMSQAEVLAHVPLDAQKQYAGQSVVSITRSDGDDDKPVRQQSYVNTLGHAMCDFFDCKFYSTAEILSLDLTFYGIAENSVAAAMAFEMAYNIIAEWARAYKGVASKNSYCHGVCDQLLRDAHRAKAEEEAQAKRAELRAVADTAEQEEAHVAEQLARLEPPIPDRASTKSESPEPRATVETDDDDDDFSDVSPEIFDEFTEDELEEDFLQPNFEVKEENPIDFLGDLDMEIENLIKKERQQSEMPPEGPPAAAGPSNSIQNDADYVDDKTGLALPATSAANTQLDRGWRSHGELVLFRDTSFRIAEDFLKEKGVKLHTNKNRPTTIRDSKAYEQGEKDSSKIDVKRKRLESG